MIGGDSTWREVGDTGWRESGGSMGGIFKNSGHANVDLS